MRVLRHRGILLISEIVSIKCRAIREVARAHNRNVPGIEGIHTLAGVLRVRLFTGHHTYLTLSRTGPDIPLGIEA